MPAEIPEVRGHGYELGLIFQANDFESNDPRSKPRDICPIHPCSGIQVFPFS
jgi:hypothetical protein